MHRAVPILLLLGLVARAEDPEADLPVNVAALRRHPERPAYGVRNLIALPDIESAARSGERGTMAVDFTHVRTLLDGRAIDPAQIYGTVWTGPWPFEAAETGFAYRRFRTEGAIAAGKGSIDVTYLLRPDRNSEGWTDGGTLAVRFDLRLEREGRDEDLGVYETVVRFRRDGTRLPAIVEGPHVHLVRSDDPERAVVTFRTDVALRATVVLDSGAVFTDAQPSVRHAIALDGLTPATVHRYGILLGEAKSSPQPTLAQAVLTRRLRTAPSKGAGPVRVAFFGDCRAGPGGGDRDLMGVNRETIERLMAVAYREDAGVFLVGGDLVNGYTTVPGDFRAQLHAWKQAVAGFGGERPLYPAIGNHEALLRNFDAGGRYGISVDRWPYATESAEAVFADEFVNPDNGPEPSDPRRPPYRENVYSFQYGPVRCICFNNNYWISYAPEMAGGCPEGYLLEDQLAWIEKEIRAADGDPTVRYVLLYAQEPILPNGGHVRDAMWHAGSNRMRAHTWHGPEKGLVAEAAGMLEVRNRFLRMVAASPKVAAVLTGDEHAYHRLLLTREVPVGDPGADDANGDSRIDVVAETVSALEDLAHPVWFLTSGGGGAPYYAMEPTPWNRWWSGRGGDGFYYSSQEHLLLFTADDEGISMAVLNPHGERLDGIDDLMAVKRAAPDSR